MVDFYFIFLQKSRTESKTAKKKITATRLVKPKKITATKLVKKKKLTATKSMKPKSTGAHSSRKAASKKVSIKQKVCEIIIAN